MNDDYGGLIDYIDIIPDDLYDNSSNSIVSSTDYNALYYPNNHINYINNFNNISDIFPNTNNIQVINSNHHSTNNSDNDDFDDFESLNDDDNNNINNNTNNNNNNHDKIDLIKATNSIKRRIPSSYIGPPKNNNNNSKTNKRKKLQLPTEFQYNPNYETIKPRITGGVIKPLKDSNKRSRLFHSDNNINRKERPVKLVELIGKQKPFGEEAKSHIQFSKQMGRISKKVNHNKLVSNVNDIIQKLTDLLYESNAYTNKAQEQYDNILYKNIEQCLFNTREHMRSLKSLLNELNSYEIVNDLLNAGNILSERIEYTCQEALKQQKLLKYGIPKLTVRSLTDLVEEIYILINKIEPYKLPLELKNIIKRVTEEVNDINTYIDDEENNIEFLESEEEWNDYIAIHKRKRQVHQYLKSIILALQRYHIIAKEEHESYIKKLKSLENDDYDENDNDALYPKLSVLSTYPNKPAANFAAVEFDKMQEQLKEEVRKQRLKHRQMIQEKKEMLAKLKEKEEKDRLNDNKSKQEAIGPLFAPPNTDPNYMIEETLKKLESQRKEEEEVRKRREEYQRQWQEKYKNHMNNSNSSLIDDYDYNSVPLKTAAVMKPSVLESDQGRLKDVRERRNIIEKKAQNKLLASNIRRLLKYVQLPPNIEKNEATQALKDMNNDELRGMWNLLKRLDDHQNQLAIKEQQRNNARINKLPSEPSKQLINAQINEEKRREELLKQIKEKEERINLLNKQKGDIPSSMPGPLMKEDNKLTENVRRLKEEEEKRRDELRNEYEMKRTKEELLKKERERKIPKQEQPFSKQPLRFDDENDVNDEYYINEGNILDLEPEKAKDYIKERVKGVGFSQLTSNYRDTNTIDKYDIKEGDELYLDVENARKAVEPRVIHYSFGKPPIIDNSNMTDHNNKYDEFDNIREGDQLLLEPRPIQSQKAGYSFGKPPIINDDGNSNDDLFIADNQSYQVQSSSSYNNNNNNSNNPVRFNNNAFGSNSVRFNDDDASDPNLRYLGKTNDFYNVNMKAIHKQPPNIIIDTKESRFQKEKEDTRKYGGGTYTSKTLDKRTPAAFFGSSQRSPTSKKVKEQPRFPLNPRYDKITTNAPAISFGKPTKYKLDQGRPVVGSVSDLKKKLKQTNTNTNNNNMNTKELEDMINDFTI